MNGIPTQADTTATAHNRRPVLPLLNRVVVGATITVAAVAIATDDAGSITRQPPPRAAATAVAAPSPWWADPAQHPANQDPAESADRAGTGSIDPTSEPPAPWWAQRR